MPVSASLPYVHEIHGTHSYNNGGNGGSVVDGGEGHGFFGGGPCGVC